MISLWLSLPKSYLHIFTEDHHVESESNANDTQDCSLCHANFLVYHAETYQFDFKNDYYVPYYTLFQWTCSDAFQSHIISNDLSPPLTLAALLG